MGLALMTFSGNPNVGLFAFATQKFCLVGHNISDEQKQEIQKALDVPIIQLNLCGTPLVGVFASGDENCVLLPDLVFDSEKKELEKNNIPYRCIQTINTALGNNVLCTKKAVLVGSEMEKNAIEQIQDAMQRPVHIVDVADISVIGAVSVANDKGCLISADATDEQVAYIEELTSLPTTVGTVTFGSGFVSSGIIANNNGLVMSKSSTGVEINNVDHALGFVDNE